jgi:hypothetical protein
MISRTLVIIVGAITLLTFSGVTSALATTTEGNQNPDLLVSVSLASRGTLDPDQATVGDTVEVVLSVENTKPWTFQFRMEEVRLNITVQMPLMPPLTVSGTVFLSPEETLRVPLDFLVTQFHPKGEYSLTLEAIEVGDPAAPPSSATATLTVL